MLIPPNELQMNCTCYLLYCLNSVYVIGHVTSHVTGLVQRLCADGYRESDADLCEGEALINAYVLLFLAMSRYSY